MIEKRREWLIEALVLRSEARRSRVEGSRFKSMDWCCARRVASIVQVGLN